jgi:hypothetical protein
MARVVPSSVLSVRVKPPLYQLTFNASESLLFEVFTLVVSSLVATFTLVVPDAEVILVLVLSIDWESGPATAAVSAYAPGAKAVLAVLPVVTPFAAVGFVIAVMRAKASASAEAAIVA